MYLELNTADPEFRQWTQVVPPTGNGIPMLFIVSAEGQTIYNKSGAPQGDGLMQVLMTGIQQTGGLKNPAADAANEAQLIAILKRAKGLLGRDLTDEAIAAVAPLIKASQAAAATGAAQARSPLQQEFDAFVAELNGAGQAEIDKANELATTGKELLAAVSLARVQRIYGKLPTLETQLAAVLTEFSAAQPENEAYWEQAQAIDKARQFDEKRSVRAAVAAYGKVVEEYPGTTAAELSTARIAQLNSGAKPTDITASAPDDTTASPPESSLRTWRDASGRFSVVAELISFDANSVTLKTSDGATVRVPFDKLDGESQAFLKQ